jgi:flagellar biosynthetic protein FliQ
MSLTQIVSFIQGGVQQIFILVAPVVLAALVIGLIVAILQAATSIQEQTITFVPKFFVILGMIFLFGGWMFSSLSTYTRQLFGMIPYVG